MPTLPTCGGLPGQQQEGSEGTPALCGDGPGAA